MKIRDIVKAFVQHNKAFYLGMKAQRTMRYQQSVPHRDIFSYVHQSERIAFVLSTGRCGTQLLTNVLQTDHSIEAIHNPKVELLYWGKQAYLERNRERNCSVFDGARYEMIRNAILAGKSYVETNNRITFFANEIAQLYPNARFIHLVRHPVEFVKSGLNRGWYEDEYHYNNEGLIEPQANQEDWLRLTRTGKIAWLWNETNTFIEDFKGHIDPERVITITSEDMFSNEDALMRIGQFVGMKNISAGTIRKMQQRPVNKSSKKTSAELSEQEQAEIRQQAQLFDTYYVRKSDGHTSS